MGLSGGLSFEFLDDRLFRRFPVLQGLPRLFPLSIAHAQSSPSDGMEMYPELGCTACRGLSIAYLTLTDLAMHDDAALSEATFLADLQHFVPARIA